MTKTTGAAVVLALLALVGCGGDDGIGQAEVEAWGSEAMRAELGPGYSADDLTCYEDGDAWQCVTYMRRTQDNVAQQVTYRALCDSDQQQCLLTPVSRAQVP